MIERPYPSSSLDPESEPLAEMAGYAETHAALFCIPGSPQ